MFDQTDSRNVALSSLDAENAVMGLLQQSGFYIQPTGSGTWACRAMPAYGLIPHLNVRIADRNGQTEVWFHGYGEFDQSGIIMGVILLILFAPAALLLGYLAYDTFTKKFRMLTQYAWMQLPPAQQAYPVGQGYGHQQPPYGGAQG